MARVRSVLEFFFSLAGPVLWFGLFNILYGIQSLTCTPQAGINAFMPVAVGATAIVLAGLAGLAYFQFRRLPDFLARTGLLLTGLSFVATLWTAVPVLLLATCGAEMMRA